MLAHDLIDGCQKRIGGSNQQPNLLLDEPIMRGKPLMAGYFNDKLVQTEIGFGRRGPVVARGSSHQLFVSRRKPPTIFERYTPGGQPSAKPFQRTSQRKQLPGRRTRYLSNDPFGVGDLCYESLVQQHAQPAADRSAAQPELTGKPSLDQPESRWEHATQNFLANNFGRLLIERLLLDRECHRSPSRCPAASACILALRA